MTLGIAKYNKIILAIIILICIAITLYMSLYLNIHFESFGDSSPVGGINLFDDPRYEKDRTLLYGSLFLDNLNKQIKDMTDPKIQYDTKRIDIIKYSDVLL